MIDYLSSHPHLIVLIVTIVLWGGIAAYLWRIDKHLERLERNITTRTSGESSSSPENIHHS